MATEVFKPSSFYTKVGRLWFQYRSYSPLPLLLALLFLAPDFHPNLNSALMGTLLISLGEGIRLWAVGYAGGATRTRGDTVPALVHAGPYLWVRNPLYIGNILLYTGAGVLFGYLYFSFLVFLYSSVQYSFIIAFEEELLSQLFGDSYEAYRKEIPRWLPKKSDSLLASDHAFHFKVALRSEKSTLFAIVVLLLVYAVKQYRF
jgi:protein-S-isoprenylcysteine O-methyltransferase Ste14